MLPCHKLLRRNLMTYSFLFGSGDRSQHSPRLHFPQLFYFLTFLAAWLWPRIGLQCVNAMQAGRWTLIKRTLIEFVAGLAITLPVLLYLIHNYTCLNAHLGPKRLTVSDGENAVMRILISSQTIDTIHSTCGRIFSRGTTTSSMPTLRSTGQLVLPLGSSWARVHADDSKGCW